MKNVDAGGGEWLWFAVSEMDAEKLEKHKSPKIWEASSRFDWTRG